MYSLDPNIEPKVERALKGKMAEALIKELLERAGNLVDYFGWEYYRGGTWERNAPDFFVGSHLDNHGIPLENSFVEVKHRSKFDEFPIEDTRKKMLQQELIWQPMGLTLVLLVPTKRPCCILYATSPFFGGDKFLTEKLRPITQHPSWHISKEMY